MAIQRIFHDMLLTLDLMDDIKVCLELGSISLRGYDVLLRVI